MFSRQTIILECAANRVALGVFSWRKGRLRVDRQVEVILPSAATGADNWCDIVGTAFRKLQLSSRRPTPCVLVIPGHLVLTKFIKLPRVARAQREKIIRFESEQSLPVALEDLVWDSAISSEHEAGLEAMLAAVHRAKIEPLCVAARDAGFEPRLVLPATLALVGAFRLVHDRPSPPAVLINLGVRSITLLLITDRRFVARTLAWGVTGPETPGSGNGVEQVAIQLGQEITRSILFFRQQGDMPDLAQVYLAGGAAKLAGLEQALADSLKLPVTHFKVAGALDMSAGEVASEVNGSTISVELAGAAAARLREGQVLVNLSPSRMTSGAVPRRKRTAIVLAALLLSAIPVYSLRPKPAPRIPAVTVVTPVAVELVGPAEDPTPSRNEEVPFGVELVGVEAATAPYRLQLVGYAGEPGNYFAVFVSGDQPETLLARAGQRFEALGVTLRSFDVTRMMATPTEGTPTWEAVGLAVLHDEQTGEEVTLDSRARKFTATPRAILRFARAADGPRVLETGETFSDESAIYRVERIQLDPPEVLVAMQAFAGYQSERRMLHPLDPEVVPSASRP